MHSIQLNDLFGRVDRQTAEPILVDKLSQRDTALRASGERHIDVLVAISDSISNPPINVKPIRIISILRVAMQMRHTGDEDGISRESPAVGKKDVLFDSQEK